MKSRTLRMMKKCWQLYLLLLIPVGMLILFRYVPMYGVQIAFRKFQPRKGIWGSPWVGFAQFRKFFGSYMFSRVLTNTIKLSLYSLFASFPLPIILALMLNAMRNERHKKVIQTITYIPHFISTIVLVGMVLQVLNSRIGLYGTLYHKFTGSFPNDIFAVSTSFPHVYVWSGIWQNCGWSSIIYVAALSGVDQELHEAAQLDGASRFQRVIHIDFPTILPTMIIMLILSAGSIMSIGFEKVFLLQNNLNLSQSEVISTYTYKVGLVTDGGDFSYATAIGLFNSVVNMMMLIIVNTISRRLGDTSLW